MHITYSLTYSSDLEYSFRLESIFVPSLYDLTVVFIYPVIATHLDHTAKIPYSHAVLTGLPGNLFYFIVRQV